MNGADRRNGGLVGGSKKKISSGALEEARALIWTHRKRLSLGLVLMVVNRLAGLVLPTTSKYLMDDVISKGHWDLLPKLALIAGAATLVDAATSFANSQVLGVAAQRAITEMRKNVEAHVMRLPVRYFDSTKTGVLISRIMTDSEGIRNLVGTGLVQLTGSIFTAVFALGILLYLNWKLTLVTILVLGLFGGGMAWAFSTLRPLFRERGQINAEVTGRLAESLGGVRIVKAYTAEKREELVFARGAHRLFRNVAKSLTGVSAVGAFSGLVIGAIGISVILVGGSSIRSGAMTIGDLFMYISMIALLTMPVIQLANIGTQITEAFAGLDRIREIRRMATEDEEDADRAAMPDIRGAVAFDHVVLRIQPRRAGPEGRDLSVASRLDHGARRIERFWQEHAHQPGDGVQPPADRPRARRRPGPCHGEVARFPRTPRCRAAGQLPVRRIDRRQHRLREAACDARGDRRGQPHRALRRVHSGIRKGLRHDRRRARRASLRRPASARRHRARDPGQPAHSDSRRSDLEPRQRERIADSGRPQIAASGPHDLRDRPPAVDDSQLRSDSGARARARSSNAARTRNCSPRAGRYRQLYDKQYRFERDQFINPGEDFTPEPEPVAMPRGARGTTAL